MWINISLKEKGMATEGKSIRVKIFGTEYPLRGESDEMTKKVAGYVDEMINTIHSKIPEQPPLTVAVLSALNITEDLFKERDKARKFSTFAEAELNKMNDYMDKVLE
jgi:cell division protein ZapA